MRVLHGSIENEPYEQTEPSNVDEGGTHSLCRQSFRTIGAFKRHVGLEPGGPLCEAVSALKRNERASGTMYRDAEIGDLQPSTQAAPEVVFRNTPGRKRVHRSAAARQRAYRERQRKL